MLEDIHKWDKVFKNGPSKICGRQSLKILLGQFLNSWTQMFFDVLRRIKS